VHRGYEQSADNAYSSYSSDPTLAFFGGLCCPALGFVFAFWTFITSYTLLISLCCVKNNKSKLPSKKWILINTTYYILTRRNMHVVHLYARGNESVYSTFIIHYKVDIIRLTSYLLHTSVLILLGNMWLWESLSVYFQMVSGLFPNALYNVSRFSLSPTKNLAPPCNWKFLSRQKIPSKQINKQYLDGILYQNCWISFTFNPSQEIRKMN
jgi:hypothetical protein